MDVVLYSKFIKLVARCLTAHETDVHLYEFADLDRTPTTVAADPWFKTRRGSQALKAIVDGRAL
jgi:hypothetical protein